MDQFSEEVATGNRFEFGKNWNGFLSVLNEARIESAKRSLKTILNVDSLAGRSFLDIGCGGGLFSLAARRMGAQVHSFDFDPQCVQCATLLRDKFFPNDDGWTIECGSVLDQQYVHALGQFDIVYSWGVLHHTGAMYEALENATTPVHQGGQLFISIYNDQGVKSKIWTQIKKFVCSMPTVLRFPLILILVIALEPLTFLGSLLLLKPHRYFQKRFPYAKHRGMSWWHDAIDWLGGYPFEVAKPEEIVHFYRERGFILDWLRCVGARLGCNEFVFSNQSELLQKPIHQDFEVPSVPAA